MADDQSNYREHGPRDINASELVVSVDSAVLVEPLWGELAASERYEFDILAVPDQVAGPAEIRINVGGEIQGTGGERLGPGEPCVGD